MISVLLHGYIVIAELTSDYDLLKKVFLCKKMTRNKEIEVTYRNSFGDMTPKTIITTGMDTTSVKKNFTNLWAIKLSMWSIKG